MRKVLHGFCDPHKRVLASGAFLYPHDKRLHSNVLYIRELWRNFVTYIVINSLYITCNQVNFCYTSEQAVNGFREPCLFACLLPNKTSLDARRVAF